MYRRRLIKSVSNIIITTMIGFGLGFGWGVTTAPQPEPEIVEVIKEVEVVKEVKVEVPKVEEKPADKYSQADKHLLAKVMLAEAEDQSEYGQRLVVSSILNRVDSEKYPNTISEVVHQPYQFSVMHNGRINHVTVTDKALQLVEEELNNRSNNKVIYFRMNHYSKYGTPMFREQDHYFSGF